MSADLRRTTPRRVISVLAGLGVVAGMVTAVGVSGVIAQPLAADPKTEPAQASKAARVAPQRSFNEN